MLTESDSNFFIKNLANYLNMKKGNHYPLFVHTISVGKLKNLNGGTVENVLLQRRAYKYYQAR